MAQPKIHVVRAHEDAPHTPPSPPPTASASSSSASIERYQHGWRSGKPIEDPAKLKRWGYVGAMPSEYLVCTRRGLVDRRRSGQGMRIFKWPWESVAIVPTTLQRIEFTADQITREHVGVEVTGVAVYRIAEPLLAFRVLNFTFGEAASEKLGATLREMFVGAARRLIANLSLEECLTRRKETIGGYLMTEIAPVVGGVGSPDDTTTTGWGVVLDTIEIQHVRIQSQQVFAHLQAPYRAEIAARAELAELERNRQIAERRADTERLSQEAQLEAMRATRALKARTEAEATEVEAREAVRRAEMTAAAARRNVELERDRVLHQIQIAEQQRRTKAAAEVAALEAERVHVTATHETAALEHEHAHALERQRLEAQLALRQRNAEIDLALRRRDADEEDRENVLEAQHQRRMAEIELLVAHSRAMRDLVTTGLPQIATALQHSFGSVHYTQIGGDATGGPLGAVPAALAQLIGLARSFGLELPRRDGD
jgi:regulator of protease activity HflC (stomatin/prohibitin superfamily)